MDGMGLREAAVAMGGELHGGDVPIASIGTDTRALRRGALFVALRGPRFDGHDFLAAAGAAGAAGAVVERDVATPLPVVRVADTRAALGRLAAYWRARFAVPLIAVTGSNGKTTVKEMIGAIMARRARGLVTEGNLNNDIGVPLTLLGLRSGHRYAVVEMGASRPGDIDYLSRLARPTVAVITNAAPAHLEGFGDVDGVARAKGEIFNGLAARGTAVFNNDDAHAGLWRLMAGRRPCTVFGLRRPAAVSAAALRVNERLGCSFELRTPLGATAVALALLGRPHVMNALAASAAAASAGAALVDIRAGLESLVAVKGRLEARQGAGGVRVIDDTYNANPGSVRAALEVLAAASGGGEKILVLGDMGELGAAARALHRRIGRQARAVGVARVYAVGPNAAAAAEAFGAAARHFASQEALGDALEAELEHCGAGATVLVKGSRFMAMERVVERLTAGRRAEAASGGCSSGTGG